MKNMKLTRAAALVCAALLALSLAACGRDAEVRHTAAPVTPTPVPATPTPAPLPSADTQRTILKNKQAYWAFGESDTPWFYTFTDLDHNGRLEVLAATTQGTGIFTRAHLWEISADGTGIDNCLYQRAQAEGADDWPEVIVQSLPCWYDRNADRWYYVCENLTRDGAAHQYLSTMALCLKDGAASWELLASKEGSWDEYGTPSVICTDAQGRSISEQDYADAAARRFSGMEYSTLALDWTQVDSPQAAPMPGLVTPTPGPYTTPAPYVTPAANAAAPVITKDPTSESLAAGGKTWFIAHAQNADRLTWQFMSPEGATYSLEQAMAAHPGLKLEALPEDTVAVSNVPASANGWGMRARFDGPGGTAYSATAFLYVKDYARSYGGILENYRAAYQSGSYVDSGYMMQRGMSEMAAYSKGVGYALQDLDGNGVPELLVAGIYPENPATGNVIYSIYTLVNEVPVELAVSQARARWYLLTDGELLFVGSGGVSTMQYTAMSVDGDSLLETHSLSSEPDQAPEDSMGQTVRFYFRAGPGSERIELTEDEFYQYASMIESGIYLPELKSIL